VKILVSAIACHPKQGSEGGVGWNAVTAIRRNHHLHVLTSLANRDAIQNSLASGNFENCSFTFFGDRTPYHENRLIARGQSWLRYLEWIKQSEQVAAHLHAKHRFDFVHHVTYSSWRVPSPLWSLGTPLVWGPVGGVAEYPAHLMGKLSFSAAAFETFRNLMNRIAYRSKALKACVRNAAAVVCSNKETFDAIQGLRGDTRGTFILSPTFFNAEQIKSFSHDAANKPARGPLRCFAGGSMVGSKGLIFAIEAIHTAKQQGVPCHFLVASCGPEIAYLQKVVRGLGLQNEVEFQERYTGDQYRRALKESHVFLLPSFRENAPGTILEAMLAGCVPVVVDSSAQGDIVNEKFGFKVPVTSASRISNGIADALIGLAQNPALLVRMGQMASNFVAKTYREEVYVKGIETIYHEVRRRPSEAS
jgi:glycosyltransferase involved in cell wall biosynthesis